VFKVIWRNATLLSSHASRQQMHSFAACAGQAYSPAVAGKEYGMHSILGTL